MDFETSNCYFLKESRVRDGVAHHFKTHPPAFGGRVQNNDIAQSTRQFTTSSRDISKIEKSRMFIVTYGFNIDSCHIAAQGQGNG